MDQNTVIVSLVGAVTTVVGVLALLIKSFLADKPKANGNGNGKSKQLDDIETRLEAAVGRFRENHTEELLLLKAVLEDLKEIKLLIGVCADILKKI